MQTTREINTEKFRQKNARRKEHRYDSGWDQAKALRVLGVSRRIKETFPTDLGEDIVVETDIQGVPGAFGWATNHDWNDRLAGTAGEPR